MLAKVPADSGAELGKWIRNMRTPLTWSLFAARPVLLQPVPPLFAWTLFIRVPEPPPSANPTRIEIASHKP
jgi:hypothetical protein